MRLEPGVAPRMREIARAARPREACAFLEGSGERIDRLHPTENVHDEPEMRYAVDPRAYLRLEERLEGSGREVVGIFHSHPRTHGVPSATDRAHAQPGWAYLILGFPPDKPHGELRAWRLAAPDSDFEEIPVTIQGRPATEEVPNWA